MERTERDFYARDKEDQEAFLTQTWCNTCMEVDLGMKSPVEYEVDGVVFIDGECVKCGSTVTTEIADDDTDGEWED